MKRRLTAHALHAAAEGGPASAVERVLRTIFWEPRLRGRPAKLISLHEVSLARRPQGAP